jgi:Leucine-rich repeat (LRR) protein
VASAKYEVTTEIFTTETSDIASEKYPTGKPPSKQRPLKLVCEKENCTIKNLHSNDYFKFTKSRDIENANKAKTLKFKFSKVDFLPLGLDKLFPKLRTLDVSNLGLKKIRKKDVENYKKLTTFIAKNNSLSHIPMNLFESNKSVKEIDLSENKLMTIKIISIRNLNKLKVLDLTGNVCISDRFENLNDKDTTQREKNMNKVLKKCREKKNQTTSEAP